MEHALLAAFSALPRTDVLEAVQTMPHSGAGEARYVSEEMDVTQVAGHWFSARAGLSALPLFIMIYGGSATSKLFLNVREKESLCKDMLRLCCTDRRIITLSSGIEVENYERAFDEIMAQLSAAQRARSRTGKRTAPEHHAPCPSDNGR